MILQVLSTTADVMSIVATLVAIVAFLVKLSGYSVRDLFRRHHGDEGVRRDHLSGAMRIAYASLLVAAMVVLTWLLPGDPIWPVVREHYPELLRGLAKTIAVSLLAIVAGTLLGTIGAFLITADNDSPILIPFRILLESSIYLLLAVPAILIIFLIYFGSSVNAPWVIATVALAVNLSPFVAKIVAGSLKSISPDQIAAARAFGYSEWQIFKYFKVKYVIMTSAQSLLVEYYTTIKLSSLTAYIGFGEILHVSQDIVKETQDPATAYAVLALCYVAVVLPVALTADHFERASRAQAYE